MSDPLLPTGRGFAEALPMPSTYFAVILDDHARTASERCALMQETGVSSGDLATGREITLGQQLHLIRNAADHLDPGWSLCTGVSLSAATHGPNGLAIVCSPTLGRSLEILTAFAHLRAPHFRFRGLQFEAREVRIVYENAVPLSPAESRPLLDMVMLSNQAVIEAQLGRPMYEGRFEFPYPAPAHSGAYAEYFHAPVHFGCSQAAVVIPATWLDVESPFAHRATHDAALALVEQSARRLSEERLLIARLERVLADRGARLNMQQAARLLGVSDRTLSRRLANQATNFQTLVDNSLKCRALALLRDEALSISEVAYTLGYADPANFGRAFRRWFEMSPGQYRTHGEPIDASQSA